ncbi:Lon protease family protein [Aliidiomarina taiwanensis]|uniref:endopeptidase La n=1 Tax=Aliidiomarina taiwanensis TaxID=946228 RepID=A0A432X9Q5_9GAMM|nr:Lon protease family protein [Aliidiomarina taiwanensis]RUO44153.1 Lon protease family protein [Aliidiomarina taiwanensis]
MPSNQETTSSFTYQKLTAEQLTAQVHPMLTQPASAENVAAQVLAGQSRALLALQHAIQSNSSYSHAFMALPSGLIANDVIRAVAKHQQWQAKNQYDWVYLAHPSNPLTPVCVWLPAGSAPEALHSLWDFLNTAPEQRSELMQQLKAQFPSSSFSQYLNHIATKRFDDIPGNELANIIVSHTQDAEPWVYCDRVNYARLFGDIRIQAVEGTVSSALHLIRPGALLHANGGVLVVDAHELLQEPHLWRQLKHVLRRKRFDWEQPGKGQTAIFYQPEAIPIDVKVILTGDTYLFSQLAELDEEFSNFFPFIADFTAIFKPSEHNSHEYLGFLTYLRDQVRHRPLSACGFTALLQYSSSLCEHQGELSLDAVRLMQFLEQAETLANAANSEYIEARHIHATEQEQDYRMARIAEMNWQSIIEQQVHIDTSGQVVGQINGLTVVSTAGIEFGEPSRITATVHYGDGDIIDIERKAELSGSIHTKGVMILTAYLAHVFAQKEQIPLSATLVFEQSYHEVDGDSASLAELCCLLSALANAPIEQGLAVTGAIDQFGNVQAIGGINEKIQGYFTICQQRGLTGQQGIILPYSNRLNLHLPPAIREAVANDTFHIYTVKHVSEAVQLLMGMPCGSAQQPDSASIFGRIQQRLQEVQELHHHDEPVFFRRWLRKS